MPSAAAGGAQIWQFGELRRCCTAWGLPTLAPGHIDDSALADWLEAQIERGRLVIVRLPDRARWMNEIEKLDLRPPGDRGALWSKLDRKFEYTDASWLGKGADLACALAKQDGRVTLEMLLEDSGFLGRYEAEFGEGATEITRDITHEIWKVLSQRYAQSLEGKVVAYVDNAEFFRYLTAEMGKEKMPGDDERRPPLIALEFEEIASMMERNLKIEAVIVKDLWGGEPVTMTRQTVLQVSGMTH